MLGLVGWALLTNSAMTAIAAMVALPSLILVPSAEEPWLLAQYGIEFETYMRTTPRFFTFRR
jgi:protein-S-isoprenylcysteine O-methyltransferase Ste14